jgi:hypothetical protein
LRKNIKGNIDMNEISLDAYYTGKNAVQAWVVHFTGLMQVCHEVASTNCARSLVDLNQVALNLWKSDLIELDIFNHLMDKVSLHQACCRLVIIKPEQFRPELMTKIWWQCFFTTNCLADVTSWRCWSTSCQYAL